MIENFSLTERPPFLAFLRRRFRNRSSNMLPSQKRLGGVGIGSLSRGGIAAARGPFARWNITLLRHHFFFAGGLRGRTPAAPDRGAAAPVFFRAVRPGFAATARSSCAFAVFIGPAGVVAPPPFDREILAADEDFADVDSDAEALVLTLGGGADAAMSMPKISERSCASSRVPAPPPRDAGKAASRLAKIWPASTARRRNNKSGSASNRAPAP